MSDTNERLLGLAKALSDGENIDWSRADEDAHDRDERQLLNLLRDIGEVARLHRTMRRTSGSPSPFQPPPEVWGQLKVREKLGEGAAAEVFRARDAQLDRDVALKLFRHGYWMRPDQRRALLAEGQNLARVRHENVVSVHGADEYDGRVGIWMELVEGRTLTDIVQTDGPFSASEAAHIGIELCRALAAVHQKDLVHGDLKAQNVKREAGGRIVLMDFSSSRRSTGAAGNPESDPRGTPLYMAPELWETHSLTVESDIYALGVLLYHLVTGAFPVRAASIDALRRAHERGERHLLRDERPELPDGFVRTVERTLSRDPSSRFRSAGALEEALRDLRQPATEPEPVLPWEVRALARVARIGLWLSVVFVVLAALGFVTSTALNVVLGRPSVFAPESVFHWFVWGARSLVGPIYHAISTLVPWLAAFGASYLVYRMAPPVRRIGSSALKWTGRLLGRVGLSHVAVLGSVVTAGLIWKYSDLFEAIYDVGSGSFDRSDLRMLSPENEPYHLAFRADFTLMLLAVIIAAIVVRGYGRKERPWKPIATVGVILVLTLGTVVMEFPWQVLWQADFPRVQLGSERCYEVGARDDDLLLFCPFAARSKTRIIANDDERLVSTGEIESVFTLPRE